MTGEAHDAGSHANQGDIFDVKRIRRLVELMNEHDLAEIDLRQADQRIRLRKGGEPIIDQSPRPRPLPRLPRRRGCRSGRGRRPTDANLVADQEPDGRHVLRLARAPSRRRSSRSATTSARTRPSASSRP